jgi:hypothetical protein
MLFFSGKGGLSGDIWLATMLAILDDDAPVERLRENLPWMDASLETKSVDGKKESRIYISGAENSP